VRVLIAGLDGYLGWPLAVHLASRGHKVFGLDGFFRRKWVKEMGSWSAIPIHDMADRLTAFRQQFEIECEFRQGDLRDYAFVLSAVRDFEPDTIIHLGECPSAPYSMIDVSHAVLVQTNNIVTTFNLLFAMQEVSSNAHFIKLGTMGEYGTPNIDIPEGFFEVTYRGRTEVLPFPRQASSWYHWSKVHGSNNIMFACRLWGIKATDVMQGIVFGSRTTETKLDPRFATRFDFDQAFGTVVNRFCCQATIGQPLTLYGQGGQRRGFIPLRDSIQCLTIATENPPTKGTYRVFNQFQNVFNIHEIALEVQKVAKNFHKNIEIICEENPRLEVENHYYNPDHQSLKDLGYQPTTDLGSELNLIFEDLMPNKSRIQEKQTALAPTVNWIRGMKVV
jgi:UDP-sulfoquinovose synthase